MQVYTQQHINDLLYEVDGFFSEFDDRDRYFWVLTNVPPPKEIAPLSGGKSFGAGKAVISIIDPFDGRKPAKLYYNYASAEYKVGFRPALILDSQLVAYLRSYIDAKATNSWTLNNETLHANIESFLRFVIEHGFDYNPFFYYIESSAKDTNGRFRETAVKDATAILKLHSMDAKKYLETGQIITDPNELQSYREEYGGDTLEEIARSRSNQMLNPLGDSIFSLEEKVIQAVLLKTAIIQKEFAVKGKRDDILGKLETLREFMEADLNVILLLEYYIALFYFINLTGSFIPIIQPNLNVEQSFAKFRSATWDLLLLRIPAKQLMMSSDGHTDLGFIATADSSFANIAAQFVIGGVIPLPHNRHLNSEVFLYRQEKIRAVFNEDKLERFRQFNERKTKYRQIEKLYNQAVGKPEKRLNSDELDGLIEELKDKFRYLCGGSIV